VPGYVEDELRGISFLHRFGSAINHHVHLHACVTEGVFGLAADEAGCDTPPAFLPALPFPPADPAALTERVRRRSRRLAGRPLTRASSRTSTMTWTSFSLRPTNHPRSASAASDRCPTPGHDKATRPPATLKRMLLVYAFADLISSGMPG
jgi:hypothetical protein